MTDPAPTFLPPGPGEWRSLRDHFPRALTPEYARLLPEGMYAGEARVMEEYGLPVRSLVAGLSHGHVYVGAEPLVGRARDALPPAAVLWALARLVPAFRRRTRAAARALEGRPWRLDAERWFSVERGEWALASRRLQAEAPESLTGPALVDHLRRARAHAGAGYERHFALHGPDMVPIGLLLAKGEDLGLGPERLLPLLTGASPASTGRDATLDALRAAVPAGAPPSDLDALRAVAGAALDGFLADHAWRLVTGYDLDSRALGELPSLVVTLANAPTDATPEVGDSAADLSALLADVPAREHAALIRLVDDARCTAGLRDDNGAFTAAWPAGLLRRAMLAAGERLAEAGALTAPAHALEVTVDELAEALEGRPPLDAAAVAERAADRVARSALVPPLQLGPSLDIPIDALPAPMRAVSRALFLLREVTTAPVGHRPGLDGDGIGTTVRRGRACVAADPAVALDRLEPGDVLVAFGTTPAYNMALSIAGAVVVEEGGLLSHAAVIARELGLTAVIGAAGAMAEIPDGALVEVDPVAGRVRVLQDVR